MRVCCQKLLAFTLERCLMTLSKNETIFLILSKDMINLWNEKDIVCKYFEFCKIFAK